MNYKDVYHIFLKNNFVCLFKDSIYFVAYTHV